MIKSKVAVVTTGFLGLLSSSAFAEGNDFTTNGKVTKFTKEDGKVLGKVSSKDFKNNNIKTNGNFRGVFKNGYDVENVDYNNPVNSAVGLLHNEIDDNFFMGSGMFISPTVFVTVAHNFLQPNGVNRLNPNTTYYLTLGSNSKANFNNVTSGIKYLYPLQTIKFWNKDGFSLKPSEVEGNTRKSDGALVGGANIQWFNDLAVLTFDKPMQLMSPYKMAEFNELASDEEFNSIREGAKVNVLGYPSDFDKSDDPLLENKLEHGKLYKISGAIHGYIDPTTGKTYDKFTDKNGNLVDNPNKSVFYNYITSRGGLSGGGVLNSKNHVIGLHQFALDGKYPEGHEKAGQSVPDSDPTNKQAGGIIFTKEQRDWLRQIINQNKISGWYEDNNTHERYFFKEDGHMIRNTTKVIDGVTYRFDGFGIAKAQTEVAKKQGSIRVKYLIGDLEVLPSKVVSTGDVGTKYSYSTVNDNELMNLIEKGEYELVESVSVEGVLTEGEHVINVTVRLKTANLSEINQTIKSVESFLNGKKEIHAHHPFADDFNNGINDLTKLIRDTKSAISGGASQEVVDNMNKILSEKLSSVKNNYSTILVNISSERDKLSADIKRLLSVKRDVSGLSDDEDKKLRKLLLDISNSFEGLYNNDNVNDLYDKLQDLRLKYNELQEFDIIIKNRLNEYNEKLKLIKEYKEISLDNVISLPTSIKSSEVDELKKEIKLLSSGNLYVFTDDSLDNIKMKLDNKRRLSELIRKNNILVNNLIAKHSEDNKVSEDNVSEDNKASENKKDSDKVNDNVTKPSEDNKDNEVTKPSEDNKDNEVTKPSEDNKVDNEDSKVSEDAKSTESNKVSEDSIVSDEAKSTEGNKIGHDSKVSEDAKSNESNKFGESTEANKVSQDSKSTQGNKASLNDIIRSKTPVIEEIQELDLDVKYTKRMTNDDINIQKIKDFNDKIPAKFTEADSNINFIKTFLSKLIKH